MCVVCPWCTLAHSLPSPHPTPAPLPTSSSSIRPLLPHPPPTRQGTNWTYVSTSFEELGNLRIRVYSKNDTVAYVGLCRFKTNTEGEPGADSCYDTIGGMRLFGVSGGSR